MFPVADTVPTFTVVAVNAAALTFPTADKVCADTAPVNNDCDVIALALTLAVVVMLPCNEFKLPV